MPVFGLVDSQKSAKPCGSYSAASGSVPPSDENLAMRTSRKPRRKETHSFTLTLSGLSTLTDKLENKLFEAGCNDALLGTQDGVVYLDFDREAPSYAEAVSSAVRDVNKAGYQVAGIEPDEEVVEAACSAPVKKRPRLPSLANWFRSKKNTARPPKGKL